MQGRKVPLNTLAIGPEGGWTDEEFQAASAAGFHEASLGQNILRKETAVIAGLAAARLYFDIEGPPEVGSLRRSYKNQELTQRAQTRGVHRGEKQIPRPPPPPPAQNQRRFGTHAPRRARDVS